MANKNKLKQLLGRLGELENSLPLSDTKSYIDQIAKSESEKFATSFRDNPTVKYLDGFNTKLEQFKRDFNLEPIISAIEGIQTDLKSFQDTSMEEYNSINTDKESKYNELTALVKTTRRDVESYSSKQIGEVLGKISELEGKLSYQSEDSTQKGQTLNQVIQDIEKRLGSAFENLKSESTQRGDLSKSIDTKFKENSDTVAKTVTSIEELRQEMMRMFGHQGGGSMNRQMFIGGVDPLKSYTDMNLKAGSNMTISYANNNTTKQVDVTFASSGGAGSTRSINSVSINTNAGSAAGTDYVYLCSGTMTLTLPTAVGNTNLYTIKNVGVGVITIATTSAQTLDGDSTIIMPVRYTAVDLISDTANWNVT